MTNPSPEQVRDPDAQLTRERPILFNGDMVRAILAGRKTQTRRPAKLTDGGHLKAPGSHRRWHPDDPNAVLACPLGQPGDELWVRETFAFVEHSESYESGGEDMFFRWRPEEVGPMCPEALNGCPRTSRGAALFYRADGEEENPVELYKTTGLDGRVLSEQEIPWSPSIHMPRWASRITLRVTDVQVHRLQDTRGADALGEGVRSRRDFFRLWDELYSAKGLGWDANPWVWAVTFERVTP